MVAAICVAGAGGRVKVPRLPFALAQAVIGCMIARVITPATLGKILQDWPMFSLAVVAVIIVSYGQGWLMARWRVLPGSVAVWGSSPGAATAMAIMAEAFGADIRLVAVMQYLRIVFVATITSLVAHFWVGGAPAAAGLPPAPAAVDWFPAIAWLPFGETLLLAVAGVVIATRFRVPAGALLIPMAAGTLLHGSGAMAITLPPWLLAASYLLVGWSIGLRFNRPILRHAARALPRVVASILVLILLCGLLALALNRFAGIDPLTAYLATSPGGADSVAIIAASAKVDMPFVMAMQTMRFILVMLLGPAIARFIASRVGADEAIP
jgi:membrane AbrB-like protein